MNQETKKPFTNANDTKNEALEKVTPEDKNLTTLATPSYLAEYAGIGSEDLTKEDVVIQYLSKANENQEDGITKGDIFTSLEKINFGRYVDIIIIKKSRRWLKFDAAKGVLMGRSNSGEYWESGDELSGTKLDHDEKFKCLVNEYFCLVVGSEGQSSIMPKDFPYILATRGTANKNCGTKLNNLISLSILDKNEPIFSRIYRIKTKEENNGSNSYITFDAPERLNGYTTIELARFANEVRKKLEAIDINKFDDQVTKDDETALEPELEAIDINKFDDQVTKDDETALEPELDTIKIQ